MISWGAFLLAAVLMAMIPGANQILGLRNAALVGVRYALVGVAGRFAAFAILVVFAVAGLGALLTTSAVAFEVVRWAGVAYLVWLGVTTFRNAGRGRDGASPAPADRLSVAARREFITALTNPKALLLFASFLPQFMPRDAPVATLALLAVVYIGVEALVALGYIGAGRALRFGGERLRTVRHRHMDRIAGVSFIGFAGYLAIARRP
ncbi:lysine transporter LysE [Pseudoclavibacter endophyticus]|nr:lysine transporter LysE [Pseudoclavibacter endophyticus]